MHADACSSPLVACLIQDVRRVAWTCLKAVDVLHRVGIVHSDLRLANLVWLDNEHCMLIDLENCRRSSTPVPSGFRLKDWDKDTLEKGPGEKNEWYYTPASDLYQIGRMLQGLLKPGWSMAARSFVGLLLSKGGGKLDVKAALAHEWLVTFEA